MESLPLELQRIIIKFIPRNDCAQLIYDSKQELSLKYIRKYKFGKQLYIDRIWEYLKPTSLKTIFYGGEKKLIVRNSISKGQYIHLNNMNILY
uniref:F-box domain-containing protein n=1 Tax=Florenciella sp. virus SA2 TaxID=3240092 RepID=A0AB39JG12_9VIRU